MAIKLNLLPSDLQIGRGTSQALKTIRAIGVILGVSFIIFGLGVTGFFFFSKISLTKIQTKNDELKAQVKALETSEQQLILIKDRLTKISGIKAKATTSKNLNNINSILANLSPISSVSQLNVGPSKVDVSLVVRTNKDLVTLIKDMKSTTLFNTVTIPTLNYSVGSGFTVTANLGNTQSKE